MNNLLLYIGIGGGKVILLFFKLHRIGRDRIRQAVCESLAEFGIELCRDKNAERGEEVQVQADSSKVQIWVVPTNEELVVARQTQQVLEG